MQKRRQPEIIAGRVNSDGSIATGDGFTVQFVSTGVYTLRFAPGFRLVGISHGITTGGLYMGMTVNADGSVDVRTYVTSTSSATSGAWSFVAAGVQQ
jgi:hypothetical protein